MERIRWKDGDGSVAAGGGGGLVGGPECGGTEKEDLGGGLDGGAHGSHSSRWNCDEWGTRWSGARSRDPGEWADAGGVGGVADRAGAGDAADGGGGGFLLQLSGVVCGGTWGCEWARVLEDR